MTSNHTISIAPMMDYTDRHFRHLLRLISPCVLLYTEMVTTGAILQGYRDRFLQYDPTQHPLAIQLGGNDPRALAECADIAEQWGYDEVNLNVGCPSDSVQNGRFGACLMKEPERVASCIDAMNHAVKIPVTIKTRIGVDDLDSYEYLTHFIKTLASAGCHTFIMHARKAWLKGLSPKENREIPPLHYEVVYQLKKDFPHLKIMINGGIKTILDIRQHLDYVDGVMIGRQACNDPYFLAEIEKNIFNTEHVLTRHEIIERYFVYCAQQVKHNVPLKQMLRHLIHLFCGILGAREWRRVLSQTIHEKNLNLDDFKLVIQQPQNSGNSIF